MKTTILPKYSYMTEGGDLLPFPSQKKLDAFEQALKKRVDYFKRVQVWYFGEIMFEPDVALMAVELYRQKYGGETA